MAGTRRRLLNREPQLRITERAVELAARLFKLERAGASPDEVSVVDWALHSELRLPPADARRPWVDERDRPAANADPIRRRIEEQAIERRRELVPLTRPARRKSSSRRQGSPPVRQTEEEAPTLVSEP
jgi:hypothetical protein